MMKRAATEPRGRATALRHHPARRLQDPQMLRCSEPHRGDRNRSIKGHKTIAVLDSQRQKIDVRELPRAVNLRGVNEFVGQDADIGGPAFGSVLGKPDSSPSGSATPSLGAAAVRPRRAKSDRTSPIVLLPRRASSRAACSTSSAILTVVRTHQKLKHQFLAVNGQTCESRRAS